jgi:hypothetical protein
MGSTLLRTVQNRRFMLAPPLNLKVSIPHFSLPSPFSIHSFDAIDDRMAPVGDGSADNCYISKSLDATSNFETMALDCLNLHERVFGTELDMTISADSVEEQ